MLGLCKHEEAFELDTFLTLVIALGGIATGIGAIWTAMLARRQLDEQRRFLEEQNEIARNQAQLTGRSLAEQRQSFAEQNERVRLNLEVDLLLRLEDRFDGPHMQAIRRRAASYIKDAFFVDDGTLREVQTLNRDVWEVFNFYEDLGYFVTVGAVGPHTAWRTFGMGCFAYWALGKLAIAKERERTKEPKLFEDWERLVDRLFELSRRTGGEFEGDFTEKGLREFIEEERFVGQEPPSNA